jgi:hypothetical protein
MKTYTRSIFAVLLTFCALLSTATGAFAITAEVAKKCRAFAIKAHPTARAGTKGVVAEAQRVFFSDCVAKDGNVDEPAGEKSKGADGKDAPAGEKPKGGAAGGK